VSRELQNRESPQAAARHAERRSRDRRIQILQAVVQGSFRPRRRASRRVDERCVIAVDWHHPQWLAIAVLIVSLSCLDAFMTLMLVEHGAREVNPLMAPLVAGSALKFALVKIGLTAGSVVLLTQVARVRAFGRVPAGVVLYTVLVVYGALIFYEYGLLNAP
jgi:hypothetical protein